MSLYPFFLYFWTDVDDLRHEHLNFRSVNFMTTGATKTLFYLYMQMKFSHRFYNFLSIWTIFGIDVNKFLLNNKDFLND